MVALLLAGCGGTPESIPSPVPNTPTLSPTATAVPVTSTLEPSPTVVPHPVTPSTPFGPEIVNFPGRGDLNIVGALYHPEDAVSQPLPAVLLLHMYGGGKQDWEDVAVQLADSGYVVLAIDMRGHGATGDGENWTEARKDHVQAIKFRTGSWHRYVRSGT
ncbi:MAG TPA: alpha/beta fold hydrolase [Anaerolineales bacterium]|nr:alpha/beta fold hydrolase [Anaerolineales bacterium]